MQNDLPELAKLIRYYILTSTTVVGSGHPTSSMSAADLMAVLMFGRSRTHADNTAVADSRGNGAFFKADLFYPEYVNNDRLIFSKGHASPLFYSLYAAAGQKISQSSSNDNNSTSLSRLHSTSPLARSAKLRATLSEIEQVARGEGGRGEHAAAGQTPTTPSRQGGTPLLEKEGRLQRAIEPEELMTLRKMGSRLEGHPTMLFPYTEVPTGSLGQGLSVGVGMALNAKHDKLSYRTLVLLGDSEVAEGSVWEAMACASFYKLDNLIAILDVNRLGQSRETMLGWQTDIYEARAKAFGWNTIVIGGHNIEEIEKAYKQISKSADKPTMIIAKTLKGKGVSFLENKEGKHGTALKPEELEKALAELGAVDKSLIGEVAMPDKSENRINRKIGEIKFTNYDKPTATRKAYGNALVNIFEAHPNMVVMDGETSNSTFAETFRKAHPENYFEMFIAEQNMAGVASGFSRRGKIPFASTFAAFWSRAFDQIRMTQYAHSNIKFVGSHAGCSIGEDGSSQMALEDIAMFRTNLNGVVLYPSDAVSTEKLVAEAAKHQGNVYIRTTRKDTTIIYNNNDNFPIGGSKTLRSSDKDQVTVIGAGVTLHEALAAYEELKKQGINIRVIDLYSIKPIDVETLQKAAKETKAIITVEDHFPEGGIGEAVASALATSSKLSSYKVESLAVTKEPHSGKPDEIMAYEGINKDAIIKAVKNIL